VIALNLIRHETDHILVVTDPEVAKELKLEPKTYYAYFQPSYLNGYENLVDKPLNIHHLQAYEGLCRDSFKPNMDYIQSEEFMA
jgi:hypothetical protein